jgi:hypothetical protein
VVRFVVAAWDLGDLDAFLEFVHPDARLVSAWLGDRALTREELRPVLEQARADDLLLVSQAEMRVLDSQAVIVPGMIRTSTVTGARPRSRYVWLVTVMDGLIFRVLPFHDEHSRRTAGAAPAASPMAGFTHLASSMRSGYRLPHPGASAISWLPGPPIAEAPARTHRSCLRLAYDDARRRHVESDESVA